MTKLYRSLLAGRVLIAASILAGAMLNGPLRAEVSPPAIPPSPVAPTSLAQTASVTDALPFKVLIRVPQADAGLAAQEQILIHLVNSERAKIGLHLLVFDPILAEVARAHSAEMCACHYFAHESPTKGLRNACDRYCVACGATPRVVAENIYRAWGGDQHQLGATDFARAHTAFMQSPGHRANILYPHLNRIGIGIVADSKGNLWVTQMFIWAAEAASSASAPRLAASPTAPAR